MQVGSPPGEADVEQFSRDFHRLKVAYWSAPVLVAVSGGADSLALLLLARAVLRERCIAATVDHGLRPEAAAEARFVGEVCRSRGIAHVVLTGPLPPTVDGTANLSSRARALRYSLLSQHAERTGACAVATAHHADDQLETIIMRLNRGSGLAGLSGIRSEDERLIRPLLGWRKADLVRVVSGCAIQPVEDPSNTDDRFDRARLRKVLAEVDWLDVDKAARSARYLAEANDALDWATDHWAEQFCQFEPGVAKLSAFGLPPEVKRRLIERCILHVRSDARPRGSALARAVDVLDAEDAITIADVLCDVEWYPLPNEGKLPLWRFRPAPPRRSPQSPH